MNQNAHRILKKINKICYECGSHKLVLISEKTSVDGVTFEEKYEYCENCGSKEVWKEKGSRKIDY